MKRFRGLLYHEYVLLKPFLMVVIIFSALCFAAAPVSVLLLKNSALEEGHKIAMVISVIAAFLPAGSSLSLTIAAGLRYENNVPKRNRVAFSLPVSTTEIVLSRVFLPSVVFYALLLLLPVFVALCRAMLDFREISEINTAVFITVLIFSSLFHLFLVVMFLSTKEMLTVILSFSALMILLSNSARLWKGLFQNVEIDPDRLVQFVNTYGWTVFGLCLLFYGGTLAICRRLAERREKLCEG